MEITNLDKLYCAERELLMRVRVYGHLVAKGHMTEREKTREISLMQAIVKDYRALVEPELAL